MFFKDFILVLVIQNLLDAHVTAQTIGKYQLLIFG